ncbi:amidohydrolase family protein [Rhodopila globiformis]|uniref:Amidohydrolase n=1 Tax=Rhodopila globiformis TaxID=1071 RepID=A0A2S6NCP1_RHOGL|nr:amidohydrolase family protein [Rhodopila globiformis]PPQ32395.1 amidohydrolase [Rhodopila globiformis]
MATQQQERQPFHHPPVRPDWLAKLTEEVLDPSQPIIDPHHHLWRARPDRYLLEDLVADVRTGHNILATVYIQCGSDYRPGGPPELQPVGETEFAAAAAQACESGNYGPLRACAGIVGYADCRLGDRIDPVLEAHVAAGGGRFKGIRHSATHDPGIAPTAPPGAPPGLYRDPAFRAGFARLQRQGLTFEAWLYHPQLADLRDLLRAFPEQKVVLNHAGGPLGVGPYEGRRAEVFAQWRAYITELAEYRNLCVKLGGLAMNVNGFGFHQHVLPPSSGELAAAWRPYFEHAIATFGPDRCMFESNFPVDKGTCSYPVLWNAFKRIAAQYSESEKAALFHRTAQCFYNLPPVG